MRIVDDIWLAARTPPDALGIDIPWRVELQLTVLGDVVKLPKR